MHISKVYKQIERTERRAEIAIVGLCAVKSCREQAVNRGYCTGHYQRELKYGTPLEHVPLIQFRRGPDIGEIIEKCSMPITETGCWIWFASHTIQGYGLFSYNKDGKHRARVAHRVSWEYFRGPIPKGMLVCHKCDVRSCVNPDHLFLGTDRDNTLDKFKKGRAVIRKGTEIWSTKLTEDDVRFIRSTAETGASLARKYGIQEATISQIRNRRTWKHVE